VRHLLAEAYASSTEQDNPRIEFKAAIGAIALHPVFADSVREEVMSAADQGDIIESVKPILARYGKSISDALDVLSSLIRSRITLEKEAEEQDDAEEARQEEAAAAEEGLERVPTNTGRGRPSAAKEIPQEEVVEETSEEDDEKLAKALTRLEMLEYASIDVETKCFILQWLCDRVSDSKYVHDTIENAVQVMEAEEFELDTLEKNHDAACTAEKYYEAEAILFKLRESARRDYLYDLYGKEWAKKYAKRPGRASAAKKTEEDDDDEEGGGRSRRVTPTELVGKTLNRSIYGVAAEITVKSFWKEKDGRYVFQCEYENEKPLFEELSFDEVRRQSCVLNKCTDEEFLTEYASDRLLKSLTEKQAELIRALFEKRSGTKLNRERRDALDRVEENVGKKIAEIPKNKLTSGARVSTSFGFGYLLAVRDAKMCDVRLDWGALAALRLDQISTSKP